MNRRTIALASAVAVAAAAFGVMAFASAGTTAAPGPSQVNKYKAITVESNFVDNGNSGPSQGDVFLFRDKLMQAGKKKGTDGGVCTLTRSTGHGSVNCVVTLRLDNGEITAQGLVPGSNQHKFIVPITGGSRDYRTARGQIHVNQKSNKVSILKIALFP